MNAVLETLIANWIEANADISNFAHPILPQDNDTQEDIKALIDSKLKTHFKVQCAQHNMTQRTVLFNLIHHWCNQDG